MKKIIFLFSILFVLSTFMVSQSNPQEGTPKYYENAKVIRVKYMSGQGAVKRSYDDGHEEITVNLPLFEGDIASTIDGRIEFYLGRLNYLRMDHDTEVVFEEIPMLRETNLRIRVLRGGIYLDVAQLDREKDIEIQTPDCGIFVLEEGVYRINVREGEGTEVFLHKGNVEMCGENENRLVKENQKSVMRDGVFVERPFYFSGTLKGNFDLWNANRQELLTAGRYSSSRYMDEGYEDYEHELNKNGRWKYNSAYGRYTWIPYNIAPNWRPYSYGHWVWNPYYGYVWSSYNPWGWFTHHYGRWHYDYGMGWHWLPGYRWSPAWVSWHYNDSYYGWCPLSIYNRPVIVINKRWRRGYKYKKGIPLHSTSTIVVKKKHLMSSHINKVVVKKKSNLTNQSLLKYRGSSFKKKPNYVMNERINLKGNRVLYKGGTTSKSYGAKYGTSKKSIVNKYSGTRKSIGSASKKRTVTSGKRYSTKSVSGKSQKISSTKAKKYTPTSKKSSTSSKVKKKKKESSYSYSGEFYKRYLSNPSSSSYRRSKSSGYGTYGSGSSYYKPKINYKPSKKSIVGSGGSSSSFSRPKSTKSSSSARTKSSPRSSSSSKSSSSSVKKKK